MIKINRRNLLVGMGLAGVSAAMSPRYSVAQGKKHLKILILGGTGFIGPHIVREALARGHEVTLFNRGRSNTDLFPDVKKLVGDRALIVRPTYIVGPGDKSQRFTWWAVRVHRGGEVLAPGNPDTTSEIIDVRDLAAFFCIRLLEDEQSGVFNASGPAGRFSFGGMLNGIRASTSNAVNFTWVDAAFLIQHQVSWKEMPMWSSDNDGFSGLFSEQQSSIDAGLNYRPFTETVKDTLAWYRQLPTDKQVFTRAGIDPEKEARVLVAWHQQQRVIS